MARLMFRFCVGLVAISLTIAGGSMAFAQGGGAFPQVVWDALAASYEDPCDGLEVLESSGLFAADWTSDPHGFAKDCVNTALALVHEQAE